jgi:coproporphyrinogen III oxidase
MSFDIYERIKTGAYSNHIAYPSNVVSKKKCPKCDAWMNKSGIKFCSNCGTELETAFKEIDAHYQKCKQLYYDEQVNVSSRFKDDCRKYFELEWITDKQWDMVYNLAYDFGHSSGWNEILNYLEDITDVIDTFKKG